MSTPSCYPSYINGINNLHDKVVWQVEYLKQYKQEYNKVNSEWNGLKAVMASVALFALTLFPTIILIARANSHTIAASISLFSIGTAAAVCAGLYYGSMYEQNQEHLRTMPTLFPIKFEVYFNQKMSEKNKA